MSKKTRKEAREAAQRGEQGETVVVTSSDVGSVTETLGDATTSVTVDAGSLENQDPATLVDLSKQAAEINAAASTEQAPSAEPVAPSNEQPAGPNMGEILGLSMPKAPEKAAIVIAAKGEPTRHQPMKLNHGFKEKGDRMAKNKAISNAGRLFKVGKGNGSAENTVWGHCLVVAKTLAAASEDGTFTAQQLYNALFSTDWLGSGVTRPKYTPANGIAYAGWIHDLVKGAPSKSFGIVVAVSKEVAASE
jgi:hypothetical protein